MKYINNYKKKLYILDVYLRAMLAIVGRYNVKNRYCNNTALVQQV